MTSVALKRSPWDRIRRDGWGLAGAFVVGLYLVLAIASTFGWIGSDWAVADGDRWAGSSSEHWFGTNLLGQDIFARSVVSIRTAFEIGLGVAVVSTTLGAVLGALAGWYHERWPDHIITWLAGVLDSIPFYLFVAAVAFAMQGSGWAMFIAMSASFWTTTARLIRAETLRIRGLDFISAARLARLPAHTIIRRHVLPNTSHVLLIQASIAFVAAIKTEVILSFLGIGVQDGVSWGLMLAESTQEVLAGQFNNFIAASSMLVGLVLAVNLLSDALQDALDPRQEAL